MNKFTVTRYAKWAKADSILAKNPSAKAYRRIVIKFTNSHVKLMFGDVTKVAAEGGYCNGIDDETTYEIPLESFFSDNPNDLGAILADEPYAAVLESYRVQEQLREHFDSLKSILSIL